MEQTHMAGKQSGKPCGSHASSFDWTILALGALLPLAITVAFFLADVPLGKPGKLVYPYSPIVVRRVLELPAAWLLAGLLALGAWLTLTRRGRRQHAGLVVVGLGCTTMAVWAFVAPPDHLRRHFFNMQSPSHDGAFLTESTRITSVADYLREFPQRAATPPEEMKGTRVISNPPGTTLLALGVRRLLTACPSLVRLLDTTLHSEGPLSPEVRAQVICALGFAWALTIMWVLSAPFLYLSSRVFLSPGPAAVLTTVCFVTPTTLLFTPGKDPAQLLSVALPMWLWLRAYQHRRIGAAIAAGALFTLSCMVSLVHVWVAAVMWAACFLHARRIPRRPRDLWLRNSLPAAAGALVSALLLYLLWGCNLLATAWAAAQAQAQVTRGPEAMSVAWQLLGIPLFLLLAGPAIWCGLPWLWRRRVVDDAARLGLCLSAVAALAMLMTVGFTNVETPRLWIPFAPLLLLGVALQLRVFREPARRGAWLLAALVFAQVAVSTAQWSLMDMREAETRLLEVKGGPRFFE